MRARARAWTYLPFQLENSEMWIQRYLEMVLFIEEDCGRAASTRWRGGKTEKDAPPEYRVGRHRRAAFQPGKFRVMYQVQITNIAR